MTSESPPDGPSGSERDRILKERARLLARAPQSRAIGEDIDVVAFVLARETYAVELKHVREIYPLNDLTPIPCTPSFFLGIINVRGEMCPVIDLKLLFGLPDRGLTNATRAVILQDGAMELGILADGVLGRRSISVRDIAPPPLTLRGITSQFLRGITPEQVAILDAQSILRHPQMVVNEKAGDT
jgi:purine-binding chemotaxis protein CheW